MTVATFTWGSDISGNWNTGGNWNPTVNAPPGSTTPNTDVAVLTKLGSSDYAVTVVPGPTFDISNLDIGTTGGGGDPSLFINGTLRTSTLTYDPTSKTASTVDVGAGGLFEIRSSIVDSKTVAETIGVSALTTGGGHLELGSLTVGSPSVSFAFQDSGVKVHNTGVIEYLSGFSTGATTNQSITGVDWGDSIIIDGANFASTDKVTYSGTTLTVKDASNTTVFTMTNVHEGKGAVETFVVNGDVISAICYARGTLIGTPDGEMPVERLRPGRQVTTLVDGEPVARTVKWLGHRRIDLTSHHRPETVAPIRIQRGAFADAMPQRDLLVSPDHAIFVDGRLICARQLVNGTTIRQESGWTAVDYYHVELDRHAILLAEGLPAESYIDTGNSGFFANSGAPLVLRPDLTDESGYPTREAGSCAPFVWDEASVRPVWQRRPRVGAR
jgi:hypothetical protein